MTDWSTLKHAYGSATDLPALLAALSPDPDASVWYELWSRLCHQGTVYSASFAALPVLLAAAEQWKPTERAQPIALASSILASKDAALRSVEWMIPRFQHLCRESLAASGVSQVEFIYLLQAARSLDGDRFWGQKLDYLVSGEFPGACPHCGMELHLVIGEYGFFTTTEEWIHHPEGRRTAIEPKDGMLPEVGQWMFERAKAAQQDEVAKWISHVFGNSACPSCGSGIAVPDAIAAA